LTMSGSLNNSYSSWLYDINDILTACLLRASYH
jgi:hypothetical protein